MILGAGWFGYLLLYWVIKNKKTPEIRQLNLEKLNFIPFTFIHLADAIIQSDLQNRKNNQQKGNNK